jgi:hypothetical protein
MPTSDAALCADGLQGSEPFQVFENKRVERLTRDRQADNEADHGHDQDVGSASRLVYEEVRSSLPELSLVRAR